MRFLALNIETMADSEKANRMPEPDVKLGNLKDEAKIAAKIQKVKLEQRQKMALDPTFGRVLCATFAFRPEEEGSTEENQILGDIKSVTIAVDKKVSEKKLIEWIWKQVVDKGLPLATFNGAGFDIPYLARRSLLNRIRIPVIDCKKYSVADPRNQSHFDVMQYFHQGEVGFGMSNPLNLNRTLGYYAEQVLDEAFPYADFDQSTFGDHFENGDTEMAEGICEWNTEKTLLLAEHIVNYC